jgi:L,D-peptidoglycan transpeptidase YkuD (ErfK/YbiS/YcfS/YnhG family)
VNRGSLFAVAIAAVAACGDGKRASHAPPAALPARPAQASTPAPPTLGRASEPTLLAAHGQLVTAIVEDWTSTRATLQLWQRAGAGWQRTGASWPAIVGRGGTAWGAGLHGDGAPENLNTPCGSAAPSATRCDRDDPVKREGDRKSPAGAFAIRGAYGYAAEPPPSTRLPYTSSGRGDLECVDDPASAHYATIVDRKQVAADWQSAEQLLRDDVLYTWVIDIAHNPEHASGKGSCIFFHVANGPRSSTGCTAMAEDRLVTLLTALDPAERPVYVLLPRAEYQALAVAWGLPAQ